MTLRGICGVLAATTLLCTRVASAVEDPATLGPHSVTVTSYGSAGTSISLGEITPIEVLGEVHYPTDIGNGPYPLVVLLHGRHSTCYTVSNNTPLLKWPCGAGEALIPSYRGYDYLATILASHGMIVASVSANGINARDNSTTTFGMNERGLLLQHHLGMWNTFNTSGGAFGSLFVGRVDLTRVGTMGHSRGGEGVIWNYERNLSLGSPYGIRAVLPLAPVDFYGHFINNVPLGVILPYCDGDVYSLPGVGYFDDARYSASGDPTPKYTILSLGSNHNYFNRMWTPGQFVAGTSDDWGTTGTHCGSAAPGNGRLTSTQQRGFGAAYMSAFFRRHLQDQTQFDVILNRDAPPPPSAQTTTVYTAFFPGASDRKDIDRLSLAAELTTNNLGGAVTSSGLVGYQLCGESGPICAGGSSREPHQSYLSSAELGWTSSTATYTNAIPDLKRDVSNFATLQFRTAVDFNDAKNAVGQSQDLSVRLTDGYGRTSTIRASDYTSVLYYPPGGSSDRAAIMNTARIPMSAFTNIDITSIVSVSFLFDRKATGNLIVSDIAFSNEGMTVAEKWLVSTG